MKTQTEINFTKISKEHTNVRTSIVKETLAVDIVPVKTFTIIDQWNIQRNDKPLRTRRRLA